MHTRQSLPLGTVDVHAHFVPDVYRRAAIAAGHAQPDGMPAIPPWSVQRALDVMDSFGIASSVLSISSPGVHFGDDVTAESLARAVNDAGARVVADHPNRFGMFASLALPNVDAALQEIERVFDTLNADGIVLLSNHGGVYLGAPVFEAVFAELNRRSAVVFIHPTAPYCHACQPRPDYPAPMIEFMFETTRAVTHLILSGTLARYTDLKVIVPHAGAVLPTLSDRIVGMVPFLDLPHDIDGNAVLTQLRRVHYDLAGHTVPKMLDALMSISDTKHLLYGSDWPFTPEHVVAKFINQIQTTPRFDEATRTQIFHTNAMGLFTRLRSLQTGRRNSNGPKDA